MKTSVATNTQVKGWGVDADPKDHPAYPMKQPAGENHKGRTWERPPQQPAKMEILHSVERPDLTAAFGTSIPPSGVSGMLRRFAFRRGESRMMHWLPLLLADRINVIEGVFHDLRHGHIPNIFAEMGIKSEFRHNRRGLAVKLALGAACTYALVAYLRRRR